VAHSHPEVVCNLPFRRNSSPRERSLQGAVRLTFAPGAFYVIAGEAPSHRLWIYVVNDLGLFRAQLPWNGEISIVAAYGKEDWRSWL
jgi:hypothetical protein